MSEEETSWKPLDGHAVKRTEQVGDVGFGFLVRWAHAEPTDEQNVLWVDFAIYEQCGLRDVQGSSGTVHYPKPNASSTRDTTENVDEALPFVHGFVKWDGCTQWWQEGGGHVDHRASFELFMNALALARRVAAELMPATDIAQEYEL